jgi:hypothetical protein
MNQRRLNVTEQSDLDALNAAVVAAIEARRAWLDAKMEECSRLKVGDDIYDVNSGRRLGRITKLYRFWRDRDEGVRDTSPHCDYKFETSPDSYDNTSSYGGALEFGTREDAAKRAEINAQWLRGNTAAVIFK